MRFWLSLLVSAQKNQVVKTGDPVHLMDEEFPCEKVRPMKSMKTLPPKDIDAYLAKVPAEARAILRKLRRTIKTAAPKATEKISYRIPVFYQQGMLVGFAAFKEHCSFFPMSMAVMSTYREELARYDTSKGTIRFSVDKPLS